MVLSFLGNNIPIKSNKKHVLVTENFLNNEFFKIKYKTLTLSKVLETTYLFTQLQNFF